MGFFYGKGNSLVGVCGNGVADTCDGETINGQFHELFTSKQVMNGCIRS
jgi:hypothetical protein